MAPKKQTIAHNGALTKGKTSVPVAGIVPPPAVDREHVAENGDSSLSQRIAISIRSPLLYEGQILQMLVDMKEQMKKQHNQLDHDRVQAALDSDNATREEMLKQLNDQLQVQLTAL